MAFYRLYFRRAASEHIERFTAFSARDDESAVAISERFGGNNPQELRCGSRKVKMFEAADAA
jgi:hypothetical protein